ncbi:MAG: glycosyltransferase 87 family protein, partial [Planctomycetota bacterium]
MNPRWGGALLVLLAAAGATGHFLPLILVAATLVWLLSLRRHARVGPGLVLAVALLIRLPFLFSEIHSDDLYRYVWEGRIQHDGLSPYAHSPDDPALAHLRGSNHDKINHPELVTIYPPLAQMLFRAGATGLAEIGLRNLILLLDCAVILVLLLWLRSTERPPGWLMVYAWSPLALSSAATGHIDPLMLLFLAGFAWAQERARPHSAAALLGLAILSKTVAVLLVPWLAVRQPRAMLTLTAVVLLGYTPYLGSGNPLGSLVTFGNEFAFNASLFRLLELIGPGARILAAALLALWIAWIAFTQPRVAGAGTLTLAGLLVLSPTVHVWYLTWFLIFLPAVGPRRWTWPLITWCATAVLAMETYRRVYAGEEFREFYWLTALEYAVPALLATWLLWRAWPARSRTTEAAPSVPAGGFDVVIPCRGEA